MLKVWEFTKVTPRLMFGCCIRTVLFALVAKFGISMAGIGFFNLASRINLAILASSPSSSTRATIVAPGPVYCSVVVHELAAVVFVTGHALKFALKGSKQIHSLLQFCAPMYFAKIRPFVSGFLPILTLPTRLWIFLQLRRSSAPCSLVPVPCLLNQRFVPTPPSCTPWNSTFKLGTHSSFTLLS